MLGVWGGGCHDRFPFAHTLGVLEEINDQSVKAIERCAVLSLAGGSAVPFPHVPTPSLSPRFHSATASPPLPPTQRPTPTLRITDGPPVVQLLLAVAWRLALL